MTRTRRSDPVLFARLGAERPNHGDATIVALAWSPDGRLLASLGDDRRIKVWDRAGKLLYERAELHAILVQFCGADALLGVNDQGLVRWDLPTDDVTLLLASPAELDQIAVDQRARRAVVLVQGVAQRWDLETGAHHPLPAPSLPRADVDGVAISPDGRWILGFCSIRHEDGSGTTARALVGWDGATGEERYCHVSPQYFDGRFLSIAFSPDATQVVIVSDQIGWYALDTGREVQRAPVSATAAAFTQDGAIFFRTYDAVARWGAPPRAFGRALVGACIAVAPAGDCGALSEGGALHLFGPDLALRSPGPGHTGPVQAVIPAGAQLVSAAAHEVCVWTLATGALLLTLNAPAGRTAGACPDDLLWVGADDAGIKVWRGADYWGSFPLPFPRGPRVLSADGQVLFGWGDADQWCVWRVADGALLRTRPQAPVYAAALSADGALLAIAAADLRGVEVHDLRSGQVHALPHVTEARALALTAETLACCGPNGVTLYALSTGKRQFTLRDGAARFSAVALLDGYIVAGGEDGRLRVWAG